MPRTQAPSPRKRGLVCILPNSHGAACLSREEMMRDPERATAWGRTARGTLRPAEGQTPTQRANGRHPSARSSKGTSRSAAVTEPRAPGRLWREGDLRQDGELLCVTEVGVTQDGRSVTALPRAPSPAKPRVRQDKQPRRALCDRAEVTCPDSEPAKNFWDSFLLVGFSQPKLDSAERSKPSEFLGNSFPPNTSLPQLCSIYLGPGFS